MTMRLLLDFEAYKTKSGVDGDILFVRQLMPSPSFGEPIHLGQGLMTFSASPFETLPDG
jgi:hypothetical protein